ncbi:septum formation family protein [Microbacterium pseudoresistens]|uniref:Septum formation-related domain-containing protein n=1 Tax=Microbacterium pseudoresistens TaxID=640634 RepID=A0A7Y9EWP0_9MICO|nr:septum formation family protein [Microbacterium pseudoresistens]NYD55352.1 hypothetical protein [Microbacterium pseudoresistens]
MFTIQKRLAVGGAALMIAAGLSGCSMLTGGGNDAPRDDESGQVTEGSNIGIFNLKVGDCKMEGDSGLIEDADVVPCDEPHDEEVYYELTMDDGDYDEDAIDEASYECVGQAYTDFVGVAYEDSTLEVYPITPTQDTWEQMNDRVIQCIISDPSGPTTGSLKGSAK